jgi:Lamin Tail Domain
MDNHRHLLAPAALAVLTACTAPSEEPSAPAQADAGPDTSLDRRSPVILDDGFALPRTDASSDVSAAAPTPSAPESGPDATARDAPDPREASSAESDGSKIADACSFATCADVAVWTGRQDCDGRADGTASDAGMADAETGIDSTADGDSTASDPPADHLLITEIVARPGGAEMIEIHNPTASAVDLTDHALSDSHRYFTIATGSFSTASGSDFVAFFPPGSQIAPGAYVTVAIANASGGEVSFEATYGQKPDFELRPAANGSSGDPDVADMIPAPGIASIGSSASLTDSGEPVILFRYRSGDLVYDVDYVYYGAPSASNPPVDKTGVTVGQSAYVDDTPAAAQQPAPAPVDGGSLHRCLASEPGETKAGGNGTACHDETSEPFATTFARSSGAAGQRTPGGPPPDGLCP